MKSYLPYKYCETTFFVPIKNEDYLGVQFFIYKNRKALKKGISKYDNVKNAAGYYTTCYNDGLVYSEIHLDLEIMGSGYVAHEIQHFVQHWIHDNKLKPFKKDWENVAYIAGDLTKDYWARFYELYKEKEACITSA